MSVVRIGRREFLECAAARLALETQTASEAAQRIDEGGLRYLMDILRKQEMQLSGTGEFVDSFGRAATDTNFHRAIAEASGNGFIARLLDNKIFFVNRLFQMEHPGLPSRAALAVEEHRQIARAIAERDSEVASLKMRRHLTQSTAWYLEQIDSKPEGPARRRGLRGKAIAGSMR
ncbi:GntR family transcriptional regulator [Mesorhizobium sp. 1B3]|uniref:GntR family transcriptional regulator n=1 Tax=Mesorhizobium sp. 1B3 TaxID=3243599 RepID=UPI003D972CE6